MLYRTLATAVLALHLAFILFVVGGALLVLRWPRLAWLHLPAAAWGVLIEFGNWECPLTPLENDFRRLGGEAGYAGGFIEHYLLSLIYPAPLTRGVQLVLGAAVLLLNVTLYALVLRRRRRAR
jgi:hypothetical protein